jgi:hypothetical protein
VYAAKVFGFLWAGLPRGTPSPNQPARRWLTLPREFQARFETVSLRVQRPFLLLAFRFCRKRIFPDGSAQTLAAVVPLDVVGPFGTLLFVAVDNDEVCP